MKTKTKAPATFEQIKAILALPFMVTVVVPSLIYFSIDKKTFTFFETLPIFIASFLGGCFGVLGIILLIYNIHLLIEIGKGTLAPWNPTQKLVIVGPYRHVRNPMIIGVVLILAGESFVLRNENMLFWTISFFCLSWVYFLLKEEPDLVKRFGAEYLEYKKNVPRWLPRITPWKQT